MNTSTSQSRLWPLAGFRDTHPRVRLTLEYFEYSKDGTDKEEAKKREGEQDVGAGNTRARTLCGASANQMPAFSEPNLHSTCLFN